MSETNLSAEERLDIQELFAHYCWGLNTGKGVDSWRTNIYALGHWNNICVVEQGEWLFREIGVTIRSRDTVPWVGEDRAIFQPTVGNS
jgi:hypothetical protein